MKKYLIFDLDWTLIESNSTLFKKIINYIKGIDPEYVDKAKYIFKTKTWMSAAEQLKIIFDDKKNFDYNKMANDLYSIFETVESKIRFFKNVPEKILELSKKYKLFLSTWNSTQFANEMLEKWWIKDCFELIYWSSEIPKWIKHLEIFKDYSEDDDFYNNSIYIWDWEMDKLFAEQMWVSFVRIWNFKKDKYEINSVAKIDIILNKF